MPKKASRARKHRTEFRTSKGTKRYLKRDAAGRIIDNQSYKKAHAADIRRKSRAERGE